MFLTLFSLKSLACKHELTISPKTLQDIKKNHWGLMNC